MKKKGTYLLILILAILAVGLYFPLSGKKGSLSQRDRNFQLEGEDLEVVRIEMQRQDEELLSLEKDAEGIWHVNNQFRANELAVKELLGTLRHLTVRLPVGLSEQEKINAALEQQGVLVTIFAQTHWIILPGNIRLIPRIKRVQRMLAGEDTPDGESTYMRLLKSDMPFAVHVPGIQRGLEDLFSTDVTSWRDPVVLDLTAAQLNSVEVFFPLMEDESFSLKRLPGSIRFLQDGQPVDSILVDWPKISRYLDSFTGLHYEKHINGEDQNILAEEMRKPHFFEIHVTDLQDRTTQLRFFYRILQQDELTNLAPGTDTDPNRFFLQVNNGEIALAQYFVFNRIMRPFSFFLLQPETSKDG